MLDLFRSFSHRVHANVRSARVRRRSGRMYQRKIFRIFVGTKSSGICPMGNFSSGPFSSSVCGRRLWLHLRMTTPSLRSSSPGLLRMIVFSVVASVMQNCYSAPVRSIQRFISCCELAVRQRKGMCCSCAYS